MAFALVKISFQIRKHTYGRYGDSFGAPCESPVRSKDFNRPHDIVIIVKRLPHSHENGIGQAIGFIYADELGNNVGSREVSMKSLPACHAEATSHLASGLT